MIKNLIRFFTKKNEPVSAASTESEAPVTIQKTTQPLKPVVESSELPSESYEPSQFLVGVGQSVGKQRGHNEDALYSFYSVLSDGAGDLPIGLFIIADGMGGHQHGEVASGVAVRAMANYLVEKLHGRMMGQSSAQEGESLQEWMEAGVREAQRAVLRHAPGGGTTLTAAVLIDRQMTIAHVGDSRLYLITSNDTAQVITNDHSLVRRLQELGQISEEDAANHPQKNVLYRALGQIEPFRPDLMSVEFPNPGWMLLCSDGLWGQVPQKVIAEIVTTSKHPTEACQRLVDAANDAGGPDNISAILVQYLTH